MVRLKVGVTFCVVIRVDFPFNSTMVRLKDVRCVYHKNLTFFQFHYGTIKRILYFFLALEKTAFNSTMVRLKGFGRI